MKKMGPGIFILKKQIKHIELKGIVIEDRASLVAQRLKRLPAKRETWVRSLGWEDPLEKGIATQSIILAWTFPVDRGAWQAFNRDV